MYLWLLIDATITKPPSHPQPQQDVLNTAISLPLSIMILLVIIAFILGTAVSWIIAARQKRVDSVSAIPPLSSDMSGNTLSFVERSLEQRGSYQVPDPLTLPSTPLASEGLQTHSTSPDSSLTAPQLVKEEPLNNESWLHLAEECIGIFDELDRIAPNVDTARQEMIRHVKSRLQEILTRSGVKLISHDTAYDRSRHQLEPPNLDIPSGTPTIEIVSPGFVVGRRVLRPAHVRVATMPSST
jgi:hypothetical protein